MGGARRPRCLVVGAARRVVATRTGMVAPGAVEAGKRLFLLSPNRRGVDVLFSAGME